MAIGLEKRIKTATVDTDLAKLMGISIIYFELDKSTITKKAEFELAKIYEVMLQYPRIKTDVRSHTDSQMQYGAVFLDRLLADEKIDSLIKLAGSLMFAT